MESDLLGKIFIGGTSLDTNKDRLKEYFQIYGEVVEATIVIDRSTGRSRGFGFVVFADPAVAERVVMEKHQIDGRTVQVNKIVAPGSLAPARTKRIIVGGLASTVTESDFKKYFDQFGTITKLVLADNSQNPRGGYIGFIHYDSEDAVEVLLKTSHELNGKMIEVHPN